MFLKKKMLIFLLAVGCSTLAAATLPDVPPTFCGREYPKQDGFISETMLYYTSDEGWDYQTYCPTHQGNQKYSAQTPASEGMAGCYWQAGSVVQGRNTVQYGGCYACFEDCQGNPLYTEETTRFFCMQPKQLTKTYFDQSIYMQCVENLQVLGAKDYKLRNAIISIFASLPESQQDLDTKIEAVENTCEQNASPNDVSVCNKHFDLAKTCVRDNFADAVASSMEPETPPVVPATSRANLWERAADCAESCFDVCNEDSACSKTLSCAKKQIIGAMKKLKLPSAPKVALKCGRTCLFSPSCQAAVLKAGICGVKCIRDVAEEIGEGVMNATDDAGCLASSTLVDAFEEETKTVNAKLLGSLKVGDLVRCSGKHNQDEPLCRVTHVDHHDLVPHPVYSVYGHLKNNSTIPQQTSWTSMLFQATTHHLVKEMSSDTLVPVSKLQPGMSLSRSGDLGDVVISDVVQENMVPVTTFFLQGSDDVVLHDSEVVVSTLVDEVQTSYFVQRLERFLTSLAFTLRLEGLVGFVAQAIK
jgi:hypothetical protein